MARSLKTWLQESDRVLRMFSIARVVHPVVIDMFGMTGQFDGFWLDQEHGGLTYEQINLAVACGRGYGFDHFVRMAPGDYSRVTQALEAGAGGVMAAQVDSAAEAEQFVQTAKFAPRGRRGLNSGGYDGGYTRLGQAEFAERANKQSFVAIQIETLGSLDEVEAIAAIEDVDMLFLGPSDLSQAMGQTGQMNHPRLWEAVQAIQRACQRHGKHWGTVTVSPEFTARAIDHGCRLLVTAGDIGCLKIGIDQMVSDYPALFASNQSR